jgi:site-specific DNA recombinase
VGEYERAFFGTQLTQLAPLFQEYGVALWLPEAGGPLDFDDAIHRALITMLGAQSKREVLRSRFRVLAAMEAQVREQGRYVGGRPPYGYQLGDGGRHPNAAHAGWGRRLRKLVVDPSAGPVVRWMFAQRLAGASLAGIARSLNERFVPCPSRTDAARNRHRSGARWTVQSVAAILGNPRYTGRQVWNRQKTDHVMAELTEHRPGSGVARHRTPAREWVVSRRIAHEALVSEKDFVAAQAMSAVAAPEDGVARRYAMVGLVRCGVCRRRMEPCWVHGRPAYRCRHGYSSSAPGSRGRPKTVYLREDQITARVRDQLQGLDLLNISEAPMIDIDPGMLADIVRRHELTIVCEASSCTVTTTRAGASTTAK